MKIEITDAVVTVDGIAYYRGSEPTPDPGTSPILPRWYDALDALEPDKPTGAWGKSNGGRQASASEVQYNYDRLPVPLASYYPRVQRAAAKFNLPPWLLMGIFDRESNHGRSLDANGYGDFGNGFGVGQVDSRYHVQRGAPDPYHQEHMDQCAEIFAQYLEDVERQHPDWEDKYVLKGACVAYNSGPANVQTIENMDAGTTGGDYGADVAARAQYWQELL